MSVVVGSKANGTERRQVWRVWRRDAEPFTSVSATPDGHLVLMQVTEGRKSAVVIDADDVPRLLANVPVVQECAAESGRFQRWVLEGSV